MMDEMICAFDSPGSMSAVLIIALLLQVRPTIRVGSHRPQTTENVPRRSPALSGAPNWLAAESVSARWLPPR